MCVRHSAGTVKISWSLNAPFGTRKGAERLNSPFSHPPCHTTLAPVAVNEHHAAPISHAQVVYLRGNEGLSPLCSNTAVLLRCQVLETVQKASELIMSPDFMAVHRQTCCHSWWSNRAFAYLADGPDLFLVLGGTRGLVLEWLQTRNISSPPAWSQLRIFQRWLIEFDTCNKGCVDTCNKNNRRMFMILKRAKMACLLGIQPDPGYGNSDKEKQSSELLVKKQFWKLHLLFLLFTSVSPPFPHHHHPQPPPKQTRGTLCRSWHYLWNEWASPFS